MPPWGPLGPWRRTKDELSYESKYVGCHFLHAQLHKDCTVNVFYFIQALGERSLLDGRRVV